MKTIEIYESSNGEQINNLQDYLENCYLKQQGIKTKIKIENDALGDPLSFKIITKKDRYNSVVGASFFFIKENIDRFNEIYLSNISQKRLQLVKEIHNYPDEETLGREK